MEHRHHSCASAGRRDRTVTAAGSDAVAVIRRRFQAHSEVAMPSASRHDHSEGMQACIDNCTSCHETCLHTARHCLEQGKPQADASHVAILFDCAQICATSADFMTRHSAFHRTTCAACAEICRACAAACEAMGDGDMMKRCAEECRRCADSCAQMAQMP
jgi:hypothetical protein